MDLKLAPVTSNNWKTAAFLTTDASERYPMEEQWIAGNCFSLAQCCYDKNWDCRLLMDGETAVGFVFYGLDVDTGNHMMCRYMIDFRSQNKGYGKAFLPVVIEHIRRQYGCRDLYTSVHEDNAHALHLYQAVGFEKTGKMDAEEHVYVLRGE